MNAHQDERNLLDTMLDGAALTRARPLLLHQVVDKLRQLVLSGQLPPGTRLPQEQVATELGISRTPLREAIRILVHEGLLTVVSSSGTVRVVEISAEDGREIYQVREVIDGLGARLAASQGIRPEQAAALQDSLELLEASRDPFDAGAFVSAHADFHLGVLTAAGNGHLRRFDNLVTMSAQMLFAKLPEDRSRLDQSIQEHRGILDAIQAGDPDLSEERARSHIRAASQHWFGPETVDPLNQART